MCARTGTSAGKGLVCFQLPLDEGVKANCYLRFFFTVCVVCINILALCWKSHHLFPFPRTLKNEAQSIFMVSGLQGGLR